MITFTIFAKPEGQPLTKRISKNGSGIVSDGSGCRMWEGTAITVTANSLTDAMERIENLNSNEAISIGTIKSDIPIKANPIPIQTLKKLPKSGYSDTAIARSINVFDFKKTPTLMLIDFDRKAMSPEAKEVFAGHGSLWGALTHVAPGLLGAGYAVRQSTSANIIDGETNKVHAGSGGQHLYIIAKDGTDVPRAIEVLNKRMWLADMGWIMISQSGAQLVRSPVDATVGSPERLIFEGPPVVDPPPVPTLRRTRVLHS